MNFDKLFSEEDFQYDVDCGGVDYRPLSEEAYFGKENPMSTCLDNGVKRLKELLDSKEKNNDEIKKHMKRWGDEVAKIINCESFTFALAVGVDYAEAFPSIFCSNEDAVNLDKMSKEVSIDKIKYEQEHKMVETKNGYRFKDAKGKHLFVMIGTGMFNEKAHNNLGRANDIRAIAGSICHEIGHCMQHCFFGALNDAYRICLVNFFGNKSDGPNSKVTKRDDGNVYIDDRLASLGAQSYIDDLYWKTVSKDPKKFKKLIEAEEERIKKNREHITKQKGIFKKFLQFTFRKKINNLYDYKKNGGDLSEHPLIKALASGAIWNVSNEKKLKNINEVQDKLIDEYKEMRHKRKDEPNNEEHTDEKKKNRAKHIAGAILYQMRGFVKKVVVDLVLNTLKNTAFIVTGTYIRRMLRAKEIGGATNSESFADTFASSYGYGDDLVRFFAGTKANNFTTGSSNFDKLDWFYEIPFINLITYFNEYMFDAEGERKGFNTYGSASQRANRVYISLQKELKNCKDPKLRSEIEEKMSNVKRDYDSLFNNKEYSRSFAYRIFDKIMYKRQFGKTSGINAATDSKEFKKYVLDELDNVEKSAEDFCESRFLSEEGVFDDERSYRKLRNSIENEVGQLIHILIKMTNAPELREKYKDVMPKLYKNEMMNSLDEVYENKRFKKLKKDFVTFFRVYFNLTTLQKNMNKKSMKDTDLKPEDNEVPEMISEIEKEGNFKYVRMVYRGKGQTPRSSSSNKKTHTEWSCVEFQAKLQ